MRRWLPIFRSLWVSVVFALVLGAFTNWLFGPFRESVPTFLHAHRLSITLALLVLSSLTLWSWLDKKREQQREETQSRWQEKQRTRREQAARERLLHQHFAFFKSASDVRPEDLGFQALKRGDIPDPRYRPHYEVYIPTTSFD